jgi:hypothetical protein
MDILVVIYVNNKGEVKYLMSNKVTEITIKVVRKVYPYMQNEEIMIYSTHNSRVWAAIRVWFCVSMYEARKSPDFTKKRLRWMGES